jgi:hypothetical protein
MPTSLQDKVSFALDENRMLMLGSQVLVGFEYQAFFERGYDQLPSYNQHLQVFNLFLILASAILLIAPTTYHRIVGADNDTDRLLAFTTNSVQWALHPLALALGISLFCCASTLTGISFAAGCAFTISISALLAWFIGPCLIRNRRKRKVPAMHYTTSLETRLRHVLTESRVMLPGAQALLGFQLITFYMEGYMRLPPTLQWVHLVSLLFITVAVIMLIAPAAFHRIADLGEATERSYQFASVMVLWAALPLGLGLSGELYLVLVKATQNLVMAAIGSLLVLFFSYSLWFGYAIYIRTRQAPKSKSS